MATRIFTTSLTTVGNNITLLNSEDLFVAPFAVRASSEGLGISALFSTHELNILGTIYGDTGGIVLGASRTAETRSSIFVGADGSVISRLDAILTRGTGISLAVSGEVKGSTAIRHEGGTLTLENSGRIIANILFGEALSVSGFAEVTNSGQMISQLGTAIVAENSTSRFSIENFGLIAGDRTAIFGNADTDTVLNAGQIKGVVALLGGSDRYDGRDGTVTGSVRGGEGNDTLLGGRGAEVMVGEDGDDTIDGGAGNDLLIGDGGNDTIDGGEGDDFINPGAGVDVVHGGAGRDMLSYLGGGAVSVSLMTGEAGGAAAGDDFSGFEDLTGSGGNDTLAGDALANRLFGNAGADTLFGAAGNDVLVGGTGADTLVGGPGVDVLRGGTEADVFRFLAPADSGAPGQVRDRIVDFSQAEGDRIDLSFIDADTALAGNQAFVLVQAGFTAAGQVRTQQIGGNTFVFANTDANPATAEFSILLFGTHALVAADFIL